MSRASKSSTRPSVLAGGNVDVEALFGLPATNPSRSSSRDRDHHSHHHPLHHHSKKKKKEKDYQQDEDSDHQWARRSSEFEDNDEEAEGEEEKGMRAAEAEQRLVDGFWGLDKERLDMNLELQRMNREDEESKRSERLISTSSLHQQWQEEEERRGEEERLMNAVKEEHARIKYMESFFSSSFVSSGSVLKYQWPTRPEVSLPASSLTTYKEGYDILYSDLGNISTVHVNGLQRSQEVLVGGEDGSGARRNGDQPNQSGGVAALAMRQPGTRRVKQKSMKTSGYSSTATSHPFSPETTHNTTTMQFGETTSCGATPNDKYRSSLLFFDTIGAKYSKALNRFQQAGSAVKHNTMYDGHPIYRWDQEKILRTVFNMLDENGEGKVERGQISEMARNSDIHAILKYTVFWLHLKRREWSFFYSIFEDESSNITVDNWLSAAHDLAMSETVSARHIRLDSEHRAYADASSATGDWSKERFASESRDLLYKYDRAAALLRLVAPRDLVWALYSKGCQWLPARVLGINADNTFKVRYLMTEDEFKKAQSETASRELMPKIRQRKTKSSEYVEVKPFRTEDEVCAYAFDIIDKDCDGVLEPEVIVNRLVAKAMKHVVNSSSSLSLLVKGGLGLLEFLEDMFPSGADGEGGVSKLEFVEFCSVINSMGVYNNR